MRITLKLFATLEKYLPTNRGGHNEAVVDVPDGASGWDVLRQFGVPREEVHMALVDGLYLAPEELESVKLKEGQTLAVWPPVAGG